MNFPPESLDKSIFCFQSLKLVLYWFSDLSTSVELYQTEYTRSFSSFPFKMYLCCYHFFSFLDVAFSYKQKKKNTKRQKKNWKIIVKILNNWSEVYSYKLAFALIHEIFVMQHKYLCVCINDAQVAFMPTYT